MSNKHMIVAALCALAIFLTAHAAVTVPDIITNEARFWLDASTLPDEVGSDLDTWADVRGSSYPLATTSTAIKPQLIEIGDGPLLGKKAVTFFSRGTICDMAFNSVQTIQTAFFVVDLDVDQYAFLLGGPQSGSNPRNYGFHRGANGTYRYIVDSNKLLAQVRYWNNGVPVSTPHTTLIPSGYQLIT